MHIFETYSNYYGDKPAGPPQACHQAIAASIWLSLMSWTAGGSAAPVTLPGRILFSGYTFMIVIILALYTANLAAFFTAGAAGSVRVFSCS